MQVRPGYKQTEVGVIPEDWGVTSIGNIASAEGGYAFSSKKFLRSGTYQVVKMSNLYGGSLDLERSASFLNELDDQEKHYLLRPADILITLTGTIGKRDYGYSHKIDHGQNLLLNQRVARLIVGDSANSSYVESQIKMPCFLDQFFDVSKGGTGNQANVGTGDVAVIRIPLPPLHEQEAIAEALSDADALIESLEQLLAKKRLIKQGAMQELLTGKRRLPGFSGEWEVKRLGGICEIAMGRTPPRLNAVYWGTGYKWLSIADLKAKVVAESKEEITSLAAAEMQVIRKGTLLMSFKLSIGRLCFAGCDLYTNEAICSFNNLKANAEFLYYILGRTDFSLYSKQAVKGYTLNKEFLKLVEVLLPKAEEQTAIAVILSDMDTEIAALEAKLAKARQLKQGMMQELLTGRIRLI